MFKSQFQLLIILVLAILISSPFTAMADSNKNISTSSDFDYQWANKNGPWDFSGLIGFYNPGVGLQGLAAYRVINSILPDVDESLSVESGIGFSSVNTSTVGVNVSYTVFEIPIQARWDFRLPDTKFIVGPRAGISYLFGGSYTVNGNTYKDRDGLYFQIGGFGMFQINDRFSARAGLSVGGYTTISFGVNYAL